MARSGGWLAGAILACCISSCDDEPTKPLTGAGLRFEFPQGADSLEGLRVALLDSDQTYVLDDCAQTSQIQRYSSAPQTIGSCDSVQIQITNLLGEEVKHLACPVPPETTCNVNDLYWDGTDADGDAVPGGYYAYHLQCFQADSVVSVQQGMYVPAGPEELCDWPLWSQDMVLPSFGRVVDFAPFPTEIDLGSIDVIQFRNPYLVRVHASGMQVFEQEVTLIEGKYVDIAVTFTSLETP